jgi:hypothetical protein
MSPAQSATPAIAGSNWFPKKGPKASSAAWFAIISLRSSTALPKSPFVSRCSPRAFPTSRSMLSKRSDMKSIPWRLGSRCGFLRNDPRPRSPREREFFCSPFGKVILLTPLQFYISLDARTGNHDHYFCSYLSNRARHAAAVCAKAYGTATSNQCSLVAVASSSSRPGDRPLARRSRPMKGSRGEQPCLSRGQYPPVSGRLSRDSNVSQ